VAKLLRRRQPVGAWGGYQSSLPLLSHAASEIAREAYHTTGMGLIFVPEEGEHTHTQLPTHTHAHTCTTYTHTSTHTYTAHTHA